MTFTWETIVLLVGLILNIIYSYDNRKKSSAEKDKLEAETALLYADMAASSAKREKALKDDIIRLEKVIVKQNEQIEELRKTSVLKDGRIKELEDLTHKQETEIRRLRTELDQLKRK